MSNLNYYILSWIDYEEYVPHFFTNQEDYSQAEFQSICDELVPLAGKAVLMARNDNSDNSYIGWNDIVEALAFLLQKKGFTYVSPVEAKFCGTSIIKNEQDQNLNLKLESSLNDILNFNKKIYDPYFSHKK